MGDSGAGRRTTRWSATRGRRSSQSKHRGRGRGRSTAAAFDAAIDSQGEREGEGDGGQGLDAAALPSLAVASLGKTSSPRRLSRMVPLGSPSDVRETEVLDIKATLEARRRRRLLLAVFEAIRGEASMRGTGLGQAKMEGQGPTSQSSKDWGSAATGPSG